MDFSGNTHDTEQLSSTRLEPNPDAAQQNKAEDSHPWTDDLEKLRFAYGYTRNFRSPFQS